MVLLLMDKWLYHKNHHDDWFSVRPLVFNFLQNILPKNLGFGKATIQFLLIFTQVLEVLELPRPGYLPRKVRWLLLGLWGGGPTLQSPHRLAQHN